MDVYIVRKSYYNYCDVFDEDDSFWLDENKALERALEVEIQYESEGKSSEQYWVNVNKVKTSD